MIFFSRYIFPIAILTLNQKNEYMNQAIQLNSNILNDGELFLKNVSLKRGQEVEIIILFKNNKKIISKKEKSLTNKTTPKKKLHESKYMTGKDILKAAGLWAHRSDIENSVEFVQRLRQTENERIFK
jgi:predicted DNA-binding antitoxin AbrB/MazE fold protein